MKLFEILKIPSLVQNVPPPETEILAAMAPLTGTGASVELLFYHGEDFDDQIHMYVVLHEVPQVEIINTVKRTLQTTGYQVTEFDKHEEEILYHRYVDHFPQQKLALAKGEKMITHNLTSYYWPAPLTPKEMDNHNMVTTLFNELRHYADTYISITLFPAVCNHHEMEHIYQLDTSLQTFGTGIEYKGHPYHSAHKVYRCLLERPPMFLFTICLSSTDTCKSLDLAKQVATIVQNQTEEGKFRILPIGSFKRRPLQNGVSYPKELLLYIINNTTDPQFWKGKRPANSIIRLSHFVSLEEAGTFFQFPFDDRRIRGMKIGGYRSSNELLPNANGEEKGRIRLGETQMGNQISISTAALSQHGTITGMPGSGKTTLCQDILHQAHNEGMPFLVLEGEKHEFRELINIIPSLQIYTPGSDVAPLKLNIFLPGEGIPMNKHKDMLWDCMKATLYMPEPIDVIVQETLGIAYAKYGWKAYSKTGDPDVIPFGMAEFIQVYRDLLKNGGYEHKVKMNLDQGAAFRLGFLLESATDIFATTNSVSLDSLLSKPTIIELAEIRSQEIKNIFVSVLLTYVGGKIKSDGVSSNGNLILADETHTFLSPDVSTVTVPGTPNPSQYVTGLVRNLIAEVRGFHCGIFISEQRPNGIGTDIMSLTDLNVSFRCIEESQRDLICGSAPFTEEDKLQLTRLDVGECFVYHHNLQSPQLIKTRNFAGEYHLHKMSDRELLQHKNFVKNRAENMKPYPACTEYCPLSYGCNSKIRADGDYIALNFWPTTINDIHKPQDLFCFCNHIPDEYPEVFKKYEGEEYHASVVCARQAFLRKIALKKNWTLSKKQEHVLLSTYKVLSKEDINERL